MEDTRTCCRCGGDPTPDELPESGNFQENGIQLYICFSCWFQKCYKELDNEK